MTDLELALRAASKAQPIIDEYLEPRLHDYERMLDRSLEILDRNDVVAAVARLRSGSGMRLAK